MIMLIMETKHWQLLSAYSVQEIILGDLHLLSLLIFTIILGDNVTLLLHLGLSKVSFFIFPTQISLLFYFFNIFIGV